LLHILLALLGAGKQILTSPNVGIGTELILSKQIAVLKFEVLMSMLFKLRSYGLGHRVAIW